MQIFRDWRGIFDHICGDVVTTGKPDRLLPILLKRLFESRGKAGLACRYKAQVEHERIDNNAKEWKTNGWKFSVGNVAIAGKRITKTNGRVAARENPDFSYRAIESARKYVNKLSDERKAARDVYSCVFS